MPPIRSDLKSALLASPSAPDLFEQFAERCVKDQAWQEMYEVAAQVAASAAGESDSARLWRSLARVVSSHAMASDDPLLESQLRMRAGDMLASKLEDKTGALEQYRLAVRACPDDQIFKRALEVTAPSDPLLTLILSENQERLMPPEADRRAVRERIVRLHIALADREGAQEALDAFWERRREREEDDGLALLRELQSEISALAPRESREGADDRSPTVIMSSPFALEGDAKEIDDMKSESGQDAPPAPLGAEELDEARERLESNPEDSESWRRVAATLRVARRHRELVDHLGRWIAHAGADRRLRRELLAEASELWEEQLNNPSRATKLLKTAFMATPDDEVVVNLLAGQYIARERFKALADLYEEARLATRDRSVERDLLRKRAEVLWRNLGELEEAEKLYRRLRAHPSTAEATLEFYEAYYTEREDWRKLFNTLANRQATAGDEARIEIGVRMARLADEQMNTPDKAIEAWKRVLSLDPNHAEALEALPELYQRAKKWNALLEFLNGRISRLGKDAAERKIELLRRIVEVYAASDRLGSPEMVIHTLNRIIQLDPNDQQAVDALCVRYEESERYSELVTLLKKKVARESDPEAKLRLHKHIALLWRDKIGNPLRALESLERAFDLDPTDTEVQAALREIYRSKRNIKALYGIDKHSLESSDEAQRIELLREMAMLAGDRLHRFDDATRHWEDLLALVPGDEEAIAALQALYAKSGSWERYADLLLAQLDDEPNDEKRAELLGRLGQLYFDRLQDLAQALEFFSELSKLAPGHPLARTYLQKIHIARQSWGELEAFYRESGDWRSYISVLSDHQERESDVALKVRLNLQIAHLYEDHLNDPVRALQRYERARKLSPADLETARLLVPRYRERKDWRQLASVYETLAEHSEDRGEQKEAQRELVRLALELGDFARAFERGAAALPDELSEGNLDALSELFFLAEKAECFPDYAETLEALLRDHVLDDAAQRAVLGNLGVLYKDRLSDQQRAIETYEHILSLWPNEDEVLAALEELFIATSDMGGLERVYEQRIALADDPTVVCDNLIRLGRMHEDVLADSEQAIECYRRLLDNNPSHAEAITGLKRCYEREEQYPELAEIIAHDLTVSDDPAVSADLSFQLGRLKETRLDDSEGAIEAYREVLALEPGHEATLEALETLLLEEECAGKVAALLEPVYRAEKRFEDLASVLEVRANRATGEPEKKELLVELAGLHEEQLDSPQSAFMAWRRIFAADPGRREFRLELERLAGEIDSFDAVARLYAVAVGAAPPESVQDLIVKQVEEASEEREILLRLADIHEQNLNAPREAVQCYQRLLQADPDDSDALDALERLHLALDQPEDLLAVLRTKASLAWDSDEQKDLLGRICDLLRERLSRHEEAIEVYERLLEIEEEHQGALRELEGLYLQFERYEDLARLLRRKLAGAQDDDARGATALELGHVLVERLGDWDEAIRVYESTLSNPTYRTAGIEALQGLLDSDHAGQVDFTQRVAGILEPIYRQDSRWDDLVALFEIRIGLTEDGFERATLLRGKGLIQEERLEDFDAAFDTYGEVFMLAPDLEGVAADLDRVASHLENPEDYAAMLEKVLAGDEIIATPWLMRTLATLYDRRLDDLDRAVPYYERLLEMDENDPEALEALDRAYAAAGDTEKRIEILRRLAEHSGREEDQLKRWHMIGELERDLEHPDAAIEAFALVVLRSVDKQSRLVVDSYAQLELLYEETERWDSLIQTMLERFEDNADLGERKTYLYRAAAICVEKKSEPEHAIELYARVLDLDPGDQVARDGLVSIYTDSERFDELEGLLTQELAEADFPAAKAKILLELAELYEERLHQRDRALATYCDLLALDPDSERGLAGLGRLVDDDGCGFEASQALAAIHEQEGRVDEQARILEFQLEHFEERIDVAETLFALADLHEKNENSAAAFETVTVAFRRHPTSARAWSGLVRLAEQRAGWDDLFLLVDSVLSDLMATDERNALRMKVAELRREKQLAPERAQEVYWEVLAEEPDHQGALDALEELLTTGEHFEKLAEVLRLKVEAAHDLDERLPLIKRLGRILQDELQDLDSAAPVFDEALTLASADLESYQRLQTIYSARGEWDEVVDLLERKLSNVDDRGESLSTLRALAHIHCLEREDHDTAIDVTIRLFALERHDAEGVATLETILGESPSSERVIALLEPIYEERGEFAKLVDLYLRELAGDELDSQARLERLATVKRLQMEELDDPRAAFLTLTRMLELNPGDSALHDQAAALCDELDAWSELAGLYRRLTESDHDDEVAIDLALRSADLEERRLENPAEAIAQYRRVLTMREDHPEATAALQRLYREAEDFEALVKLHRHVATVVLEPAESIEAHERAAQILRGPLARPAEAAEELKKIITVAPDHLAAYRLAEEIYVELGAHDERELLYQAWSDVLSDPGARADVLFKQARLQREERQALPEAMDLLREIFVLAPKHEEAQAYLESHLENEHDEELRRQVVEILAHVYDETTDPERRVAHFLAELEFTDEMDSRAALLRRIAAVYRDRLEDPRRAFEFLGQAFALDFGNGEVEAELEKLARAHGYFEELIQLYSEGVALHGDDFAADRYLKRSAHIARDELNDLEQAAKFFALLVARDPSDREALDVLREHYRAADSPQELAEILRRLLPVIDSDNERTEVQRELADLLFGALGDPAQAAEIYREIMIERPEDAHAFDQLEAIITTERDWDSLVDLYHGRLQVVSDDDGRVDLLSRMAQVYETRLERSADAVQAYNDIFVTDPENLYAITSLERIYRRQDDWDGLFLVLQKKRGVVSEPLERAEIDYELGALLHEHLASKGEAIAAFKRALEASPEHEGATQALRRLTSDEDFGLEAARILRPVLEKRGEWREVVSLLELQAALADLPEDSRPLLIRISDLRVAELGDIEGGFEALGRALAEEPENETIHGRLEALAAHYEAHEMWAATVAGVQEDVLDPAAHSDLALRLGAIFEEHLLNPEGAVSYYYSALDHDEHDPRALAALERLLARLDRNTELSEVLERKLQSASGDSVATERFRLAKIKEERLDDPAAALPLYRELLWEQPDHPKAMARMEGLAQRPELRAEAFEVLEPLYRQQELWRKLAVLQRQRTETLATAVERGETLRAAAETFEYRLNDTANALECYAAALVEEPDDEVLLQELDRVNESEKQWPRVVIALEESLSRATKLETSVALQLRLGKAYMTELDQPRKAEGHLRTVVEADPQNVEALRLLEELLEGSDKSSEMLRFCAMRAELVEDPVLQRELWLKVGSVSAELEDDERALAAYQTVLDLDPLNATAHAALEAIHTRRGDFEALVRLLRQRVESASEPAEAALLLLREGEIRETELNEVDRAIACYEEALERDPTSSETMAALERGYGQLGLWQEMRDILVRHAELAHEPEVRVDCLFRAAGISEAELDDQEKARELYRAVLDHDPANTATLIELQRLYEERGEHRDSASMLERQLELSEDPEVRRDLLVRLARILESRLGDYDGAMEKLDAVLADAPDFSPALMELGRLKESLEDWEAAVEIYDRLQAEISAPKERAQMLAKLGRLWLEKLDDAECAEGYLKQSRELGADDPATLRLMAALLSRREEWARLEEVLRSLLEAEEAPEERVQVMVELAALAKDRLSSPSDHLKWLEEAHRADPQRRDVLEELIDIHGEGDDPGRYAELLEGLIDTLTQRRDFKDVAALAHRLGQVRERLDDSAGALEAYRLCRQHDAAHLDNMLALGRLLQADGANTEAQKVFQALLLQQNRLERDDLASVFLALCEITLLLGDHKRTRQYVGRLLRLVPEHPRGLAIKEEIGRG